MTKSRIFSIAAVLGALAVTMGAFGAHGLKARIDAEALEWWDTGVRYLFSNLPALLLCGILATPQRQPRLAAWLLLIGIAIFTGTLCVMAVTGMRWLGAITPIGGLALIAGWLLLLPHCRNSGT
jgi:uncharacterized membrane protein YgdD (TMEM256/DUF423 family)